jgi:hypothetical protein
MQSLLVFRFLNVPAKRAVTRVASWMRRSAGGHTGCVQKLFLGKIRPRGGEPRKINIAASGHFAGAQDSKKIKKVHCGTHL